MIKLKTPYALLDYLLAEYTLGIVPADYDPKNPVGTGAFKYKSFTPGKTSTFTKYDDYWGDTAFVDELHIQDFPDASAKVNALQAGQIQTIDNLPYNLIDTIKGAGRQRPRVRVRRLGAVHDARRLSAVLRRPRAPGDAPDRRPPADDRPDALSGYGSLGNDLYAPFDVAYANDLPQREQDIDQAKSLLKRGRPGGPAGRAVHR